MHIRIILTVKAGAAIRWLCASKHRQWEAVSQFQPWHVCWDVLICLLPLSWALSGVPSPSMNSEGKRPPLRGHEKDSGRLSQRSVLAWGLLKAQTHMLPYFIFLFLFPLSLPIFLSWKWRTQHQPIHMGRVAVYGYWCWFGYFFPNEWLMPGKMPASW